MGETRVSSEFGILPIGTKENVGSFSESGTITKWIPQGVRPTVMVETRCGRRLQCTPDQLLQLEGGQWKEAGSLSKGDRLLLTPPRFASDYSKTEWNDPPIEHHSVLITETVGRVLGYFMGDGCLTGAGINIACEGKDQDVVEDVSSNLKTVIGTDCYTETRRGLSLVVSNNKKWRHLLRELGAVEQWHNNQWGWKRKVCVPDCIWRSPQAVVKEFISALFESDGHAYRDTPKIAFFSKYEQFCRDVQLLLLGFGINSDIRTADKMGGNGQMYTGRFLYINSEGATEFYQRIGFISSRKRTTAFTGLPRRKTTYRADSDAVERVEVAESQLVFDLSVEESHEFSGNGLTVHNCITPEEGFQHSGISVFPDDVMQRLKHTCKPGERGYFDDSFQWHSATHCKVCNDDHWHGRGAKNFFEEFPCQIWEQRREGSKYVMGIDVAEGLEMGDFSCIHVIRIGSGWEIPDAQVCEWHGHIDGVEFARVCYIIGKAYNEALAAIDAQGPGYGTQAILMNQFQYPNIYRWKQLDNVRNTTSIKAGVWTNYKTKRTMITWAIRWLRRGIWEIRSPRFLEEAPFFVKDEDESQARALQGQYDDAVSAALYAIYAAHESDTDPRTGRFDIPAGYPTIPRNVRWTTTCVKGHVFDSFIKFSFGYESGSGRPQKTSRDEYSRYVF